MRRELDRIKRFGLKYVPKPCTEPVWRRLAVRIVHDALGDHDDILAACLDALLRDDLAGMLERLKREISRVRA